MVEEVSHFPDESSGGSDDDEQSPRRRILIVDDNKEFAESLCDLLQLYHHEVQMVYDGPTAIAAAAAFQPQFILIDIGLPDMDGFEVARRLRKQQKAQTILIAVTGYSILEDDARSSEAGFDHYLVKPVDPTALQLLITSQNAT
jgi:CheY-like chemotaxis protein